MHCHLLNERQVINHLHLRDNSGFSRDFTGFLWLYKFHQRIKFSPQDNVETYF